MSEASQSPKQSKVTIVWMDGEKATYRYGMVTINASIGVVEIRGCREHPKGIVMLPYMSSNSVRSVLIEEEPIQEVKAKLVIP